MMKALLLYVNLLAASVWIGGMITIAVVGSVTRTQLSEARRIDFFSRLGHSYGRVGGTALIVALATGLILLNLRGWDALGYAAVVISALLVATTVAGVRQARGMTRLRQQGLNARQGADLILRTRKGARRAALLRGVIALLSLALLGIGVALGA